jgi:nucleoside-diphosphate-sugar epimerase
VRSPPSLVLPPTSELIFPRSPHSIHKDMPLDDPQKRRADTTRAKETLGWQPKWGVKDGVEEMVRYYAAKMKAGEI